MVRNYKMHKPPVEPQSSLATVIFIHVREASLASSITGMPDNVELR